MYAAPLQSSSLTGIPPIIVVTPHAVARFIDRFGGEDEDQVKSLLRGAVQKGRVVKQFDNQKLVEYQLITRSKMYIPVVMVGHAWYVKTVLTLAEIANQGWCLRALKDERARRFTTRECVG